MELLGGHEAQAVLREGPSRVVRRVDLVHEVELEEDAERARVLERGRVIDDLPGLGRGLALELEAAERADALRLSNPSIVTPRLSPTRIMSMPAASCMNAVG